MYFQEIYIYIISSALALPLLPFYHRLPLGILGVWRVVVVSIPNSHPHLPVILLVCASATPRFLLLSFHSNHAEAAIPLKIIT